MRLVMLFVILFFALPLMGVCSNKVSEKDLIKYVNDTLNGLNKTTENNYLKIQATYTPHDLLIMRELKADNDSTHRDIVKLKKQYESFYYFSISISSLNAELYGLNALQKLAFGLSNSVKLLTSNSDTLPLFDYIMPRTFGTSQNTSFLFSFKKKKGVSKYKYLKLVLKDFDSGFGESSFYFDIKKILTTPKIDFRSFTN